MKHPIRKIFFFAPAALFVAFTFSTIAANAAQGTASGYQLLAPIPTIDKTSGITLVDYMKGLFVATIGLAIIMAVVQIVIGGIGYVAAAVPSAKEEGKRKISGAVGGLLLIFMAYVILQALNPKLLTVGLNLEKVAVVGQQNYTPGNALPSTEKWCRIITLTQENVGQPFDTEAACRSGNLPSEQSCKPCAFDVTVGEGGDWVNFFHFDPGIKNQIPTTSSALSGLLACMAGKLPAGVGTISSLSDRQIANGSKTFAQCLQDGCSHAARSCHYGGSGCVGSSYAVDFGDQQNKSTLQSAATSCNGGAWINDEGNHLHISIGNVNGCSCQ